MADVSQIRIYYEGDDDRALLEGILAAGLLPASSEIAKRDKQHPGKSGLVHEVAPFVRPVNGVGGRAIVLADLDGQTIADMATWFERQLAEETKGSEPALVIARHQAPSGRVSYWSLSGAGKTGHVSLVSVGLPEDNELRTTFKVEFFAVDDYVLRLVGLQEVHDAVPELKDVSFEIAKKKILETVELLRQNGIPIQRSKRVLHMLRAIAAVRPSSATFVQRVMEKATAALGKDRFREALRPLVDDLADAGKLLSV